MLAALLLLEPAEASEPSSVLWSYHSDSSKNQAPGSPQVFWIQSASANAGLLLVSGLQPEDEADSDHAGWCNRASHSDTGRWETQPVRGLSLENRQMLNNPPESINS